MKKTFKIILSILCMAPMAGACTDLDEVVYSEVTEANFEYGTNIGTAMGMVYKDLKVIADYTKNFCLQEASADAIVMPANSTGWLNQGEYRRLHHHSWTSEEPTIEAFWNEFFGGIVKCNSALDILNSGRLQASRDEVEYAKNEVRAVRAFYYWYVTDLFGDVPLIKGSEQVMPEKTSRAEICEYLEKELLTVIPALTEETGPAQYGRMNRGAARALLATLYLNWEVYTGTPRWEDCIEVCDDVINSRKYELERNYKDAFKASGMETSPEIIFTIPYDYATNAWGMRLHVASLHSECAKVYDIIEGPWGSGCISGVPQFIDTYDADDGRLKDTWAMGPQILPNGQTAKCVYDRKGQDLEFVNEMPDGDYVAENEGYRMHKFEIEAGAHQNSSTDYPLFRYADILMMKAEALLRSGQGGAGALVTQVRERAFRDSDPSKATVTDVQLQENSSYKYGSVKNYIYTADGDQTPVKFGRMYDELGWEFAWECHRRRDAIRFGVYTTKNWLSHTPNGDYRIVFPLPEDQISANPNLEQNPNYVN